MSVARSIGGEDRGQATSMRKVGVAAFFSELFGTNVRYSGVSLGYQLAAVFAGGLAPFIATALLAWAGSYWPVALYVMAAGLISFVSVYLATESFREDLTKELTRERGASEAGQTT